jgi:site-specific recombinase XerD
LRYYTLALEAANRSPRTIQTYLESLTRFGEYLVTRGLPTDLDQITPASIQAFLADLLAHYSASTAHNRYRALKTFFLWLVAEQEIGKSPMPRTAPQVVKQPPDVLTTEQIFRLQKACAGTDFVDKRDWAILLTLLDTGLRREELAGLTLEDVGFTGKVLQVTGKGGRRRLAPIGKTAADVLKRYDRARKRHRLHSSSAFWLGQNGPMTGSGIYQVVRERTAQAGIEHAYTHMFRHTASHNWLAGGGQEGDLRENMGWSDNSPMPSWYGKSVAAARARQAHARLSPMDKLFGS